jgi:hypothetical protein
MKLDIWPAPSSDPRASDETANHIDAMPDGGRDDAVPEQEAGAEHEPREQQRKIRGLLPGLAPCQSRPSDFDRSDGRRELHCVGCAPCEVRKGSNWR